jgi:hypothetical protein
LPQAASKQWKTLSSRCTLVVNPSTIFNLTGEDSQ